MAEIDVPGLVGRNPLMDHYEMAESLLATASPFEPHKYQLALGHALLALLDKLDEIPLVAMHLVEEEEDD